ncbi:MAG: multiheme c-type cytochrome, partial [Candidatus Dadabacteria bacterium]
YTLSMCSSNENQPAPVVQENRFSLYSGSEICANCHKDIYEKHIRTEHHLTSAPVNAKNILGSFSPGKNIFAFDSYTNVTMEKKDSSFYQVEYRNGNEVRREQFDIVIGSGRKGQSYLSWVDQKLVQLPITYFTPAAQWSNSPGYAPYAPVFNRPITSRCLECHSTYVEKVSNTTSRQEAFDHNKIIFAVDCERCHGPAAQHVAYHNKVKTKTAKYIVNPGKLPRERLLDLCTLCHGGALTKTKPSFSFQPGDTLSNYFSMQTAFQNADNIDVHGNQFGLLALSKCFKMSNLTCTSCHNIHENEQGKLNVFSQRCLNCHDNSHEKQCKMTGTLGTSIKNNCIDCHMPKQMSHAVAVYLQGDDKPTSALMRTHYIKIYPDETKKYLEEIKRSHSSLKN